MRDIKFTCVKYLHYLWIHYYYIHPVPDRFTRNRKAYAKPETFVSAPWCLGEFRSNFRIIHSAQTYRSPPPPHPYKPSFANVERNQSTWKICYSYVPYIVYTTHNIRVLLLCRDTVRVHFFVAAPYIIYTYILYICIYRWVLYTRERSYIYIYISMCNRWLNRNGGIPLSRDRDKCATDLPATQTKRPNNRGLHFFMCAYLYIMYIYIIYVYR